MAFLLNFTFVNSIKINVKSLSLGLFFNNMKKTQQPQEVKITPQGSLGVLALGSVGLRKWREIRDEHRANLKEQKEDGKESR